VLIVHPHGLTEATIPETIEAMAADHIRALRALRPHGPYLMGGHCNGALVAFEMARQLIDQGEHVPAVVVIEARAPNADASPHQAGDGYVTFDRDGNVRLLAPHDRQSEAQFRYSRAMDRYAGGPFAGGPASSTTRAPTSAGHGSRPASSRTLCPAITSRL
jgi:thioesterase domain-containing protein